VSRRCHHNPDECKHYMICSASQLECNSYLTNLHEKKTNYLRGELVDTPIALVDNVVVVGGTVNAQNTVSTVSM